MSDSATKKTRSVSCSVADCIAEIDINSKDWTFWSTIVRFGSVLHICPEHDPLDKTLDIKKEHIKLVIEKKKPKYI